VNRNIQLNINQHLFLKVIIEIIFTFYERLTQSLAKLTEIVALPNSLLNRSFINIIINIQSLPIKTLIKSSKIKNG
jgi:hypothetical protein